MGPLPLLALALAAGLVAGRWLDPDAWLASTMATGMAAVVALSGRRVRVSGWLLALGFSLLGGFLSGRSGSGDGPESPPPLPADAVIRAVALEDAACEDESTLLEAGVEGLRLPGRRFREGDRWLGSLRSRDPASRILLAVRGGCADVAEGDRLLVSGARTVGSRGYRNPGERARARSGSTLLVVGSPEMIVVTGRGRAGPAGMRTRLAREQARTLSPPVAGLATAITTGKKRAVPRPIAEAFRRSGMAHLIAISGLHLATLALIVGAVSRWIWVRAGWLPRMWPAQDAGLAVAILATCAFVIFTAANPPVMRAMVLLVMVGLARIRGRSGDPIAALCVAWIGFLVVEPSLVSTPSFLLSFSAVLGIVLVLRGAREGIEELVKRVAGETGRDGVRCRVTRWFATLALATCAATAFTMPASCHFFGVVPLAGVPANLLAVPLFTFLVLPGVLLHMLACILGPGAASLLAPLAELTARPLLHLVTAVSRVDPIPMGGLAGMVVCSLVPASLLAMSARKRVAAAILALLAAVVILVPEGLETARREVRQRGEMVVVFLDVGQGDGAYIRTPGGERWLVDTGPTLAGGSSSGPVPAFLKRWNVGRIDRVFLSHPHADHHGGLADLRAASIGVGEIDMTTTSHESEADPGFAELVEALRRDGTDINEDLPCGRMSAGGVSVDILHPCGHEAAERDLNDRSMVLTVTHGDVCVLFTGDIGETVERTVSRRIAGGCDVIKIPHHGSRGSSSEAILGVEGLRWAVVSAGRDNRHDLPHPEALQRIVGAGLMLHRVDEKGAIVMITDGRSVQWYDRSGQPIMSR